jgi:succinate-semialdehyde dehydrogenase/glutarate-semialdehyde dehydrogenase
MMAHKQEIAELMVRENGKCLRDALAEVAYAAEFFRWYAEEAVRNLGEISRSPAGGNHIVVLHQPVGVSLLITPWNFPAAMATRKIGPALAAGCGVILKPASDTPLTALLIAALLEEAGVPPGLVNVVPSRRSGEVAKALLHNPLVRKLSFTGSTEVGRTLLAEAADSGAMRRSSCSTTRISTPPCEAPWWRRCATAAKPAPPRIASTPTLGSTSSLRIDSPLP